MQLARFRKVLRIFLNGELLREYLDYESYKTFGEVILNDTRWDEETRERLCESLIQ